MQVRGRLTIQEGRGKGAAYRGITHATLSVIREVHLLHATVGDVCYFDWDLTFSL